MKRWKLVFFSTCALAVVTSSAKSQDYPNRTIQIVVGTPAGGVSDLTARVLAEEMRQKFNQTVIVENRVGASGKIGAAHVARSAPDGYTLLFANPSTFSLPILTDKSPLYDPVKGFTPLGYVGISAYTLVVPASSPYKTLNELLSSDAAKKGNLKFGNASTASASHFAAEMLALETKTSVTHIPYRGEAPMITDLISGQIDVAFATGARPYIDAGQIRALAISSRERFTPMPDVPLILEQGLPQFSFLGWLGLLGPAGIPDNVVSELNNVVRTAATSDRVRKLMLDNGIAPASPASPSQHADLISEDITKLRQFIDSGRIKVELR